MSSPSRDAYGTRLTPSFFPSRSLQQLATYLLSCINRIVYVTMVPVFVSVSGALDLVAKQLLTATTISCTGGEYVFLSPRLPFRLLDSNFRFLSVEDFSVSIDFCFLGGKCVRRRHVRPVTIGLPDVMLFGFSVNAISRVTLDDDHLSSPNIFRC